MDPASGSLSVHLQQAYETLATDPIAAETQAKAILKFAPNNPDAEMIRAAARRRQGFAGEARSRLRVLAKSHPNHANIQHELGEALAALGQIAQAIATLRRAVCYSSQDVTGVADVGRSALSGGRVGGGE